MLKAAEFGKKICGGDVFECVREICTPKLCVEVSSHSMQILVPCTQVCVISHVLVLSHAVSCLIQGFVRALPSASLFAVCSPTIVKQCPSTVNTVDAVNVDVS